MGARIGITNGLHFQHATRPPASGRRAVAFSLATQLSGSPSNNPGCHGFNARCSSRKKSAFVMWHSNA